MKKAIVTGIVALSLTTVSGFAVAQFGALGGALGGGGSSSSVSAETIVSKYVSGTKSVMTADAFMLRALGLKEQAEKEELAAKNLTEGATASSLEDAAKIQTESSETIAAEMTGKKVVLDAAAKADYTKGLLNLAKGIKEYIGMSSDVKNFKPGISSVGASLEAATYVVKTLPDSISSLTKTLTQAVEFARENKIEVPAEATALL
jgi:hypothetical protein